MTSYSFIYSCKTQADVGIDKVYYTLKIEAICKGD